MTFLVPHGPVKGSAGMIVVRAMVMGPVQPSEKTKRQEDDAFKAAPEPSQAIQQTFGF